MTIWWLLRWDPVRGWYWMPNPKLNTWTST